MSHYSFHITRDAAEIEEAQRFRGRIFRDGQIDQDEIDQRAEHAIVRNQAQEIVCVFRLWVLRAEEFDHCYSAQYYDLGQLKKSYPKALEIGRFCIDPEASDYEIIRLVWAELTRLVAKEKIKLLFGCSSFAGQDTKAHTEALILLKDRHLAPREFMPKIKSKHVFRYADHFKNAKVNMKKAYTAMPTLLRGYISLGGWVSDHAVIDVDLNTIHVFTGLELRNIPLIRKRSLKRLAKFA